MDVKIKVGFFHIILCTGIREITYSINKCFLQHLRKCCPCQLYLHFELETEIKILIMHSCVKPTEHLML